MSGITLKSFYFCVNSCFASSFGAVQNWILLRNQIYGQDEFYKCYYRLWHLHIKLLQPQVPCFSCFMSPLQVQLYTSKETFLIEIFLRKLEIVSKGWMKIRGFKRKIIGENGSACLIVEARVDKDLFEFETQMAISHSSTWHLIALGRVYSHFASQALIIILLQRGMHLPKPNWHQIKDPLLCEDTGMEFWYKRRPESMP